MKTFRLSSIILLAATLATPAFAATIVNVKLWDKGAMDLSQPMMLGMGMGKGMGSGMNGHKGMAMMGVDADQTSIPAGKVTFEVTNDSKDTIHEMLVARIESADQKLPYIKDQSRVDEEAIKDLGEVSELDPGKSGALTVDLKPGLYLLFCNVPGHFAAGMWTTLKVQN
jgi:uncharacterized cupredoxin-like copper-binding protein